MSICSWNPHQHQGHKHIHHLSKLGKRERTELWLRKGGKQEDEDKDEEERKAAAASQQKIRVSLRKTQNETNV